MGLCGSSKVDGKKSFRENLVQHHRSPVNVRQVYDGVDAGGNLGDGLTGVVRVVTRKSDGMKFALKQISLRGGGDILKETRTEIDLMAETDHPYIARIYETYEEPKLNFYLVLELCKGGDLFSRLFEDASAPTERQAAAYTRNMLSALQYVHSKGIVHRDLKCENFLLSTKDDDAVLKMIDFGFGKKLNSSETGMVQCVGTSYYMAPEVIEAAAFKKKYHGMKCDVWSLGVIVYMMLSGQVPFDGGTGDDTDIMRQIQKHKSVKFPDMEWSRVSSEAQDFVKHLLVREVDRRPTAQEAFQHSWIKREDREHANVPLARSTASSLRKYAKLSKMERLACQTVAFALSPEQIADLTKEFQQIDTDGNGELSLSELKAGLCKVKGMDTATIEKVFAALDASNDSKISLSEFIAASLQSKLSVEDGRLRQAFVALDRDRTGHIDEADLKKLLGASFSDVEAKAMLQVHAGDDGKIDIEEFMQMMHKQVDAKTGKLAAS